jgi:histidine kinase
MRRLSRRLSVRLIASHLLVALLGGLATFVIVRQLAPTLFDQGLRGMGGAGGQGMGSMSNGAVRAEFARAVDTALVVGTLVGLAIATAFGVLAARRLLQPLQRLREAARQLAAGHYETRVPLPDEAELAELSHDVNQLGRSLAETESRRVRLLGEVAHELRTPLTVIDGYVEGMIDGVLGTGPEELGRVGEEVRRMRRLTDDLSALSRADEGRLELRRTSVDLGPVVGAAAERLRAQAVDGGLTLLVEGADAPLIVSADPDRIAQVVTNLVGNAIHATAPGGTITVRGRRDADTAEVTVADTGVGLSAEEVERVFERFYRSPAGRAAREQGSGIGLTISRDIAVAHGGSLVAASSGPGSGARFTLRLPLAER